ncbi:helical backbone metal receptor [Piscinibacter sp. XHJ-5]|uniref:helical backbone metal receptor n=1 Tax=Piscinibacter sp. XHJ-5 TaxID=3037797 RepID=UPI0024531203|nr:helical backbone metal receptor [Piscinibacter sp. XHJ-5]
MAAALRIASLVPSLTELVVALGMAELLVARTGFCVHPADVVRRIAKVGGTKDVNLAKLRRLAPTHVLVNVDENRLDTVQAIQAWPADERPQIVVTHPNAPEDNLELIDQIAAVFDDIEGVASSAQGLREAIAHELALTQRERHAPQHVLYLIWREPWMTVARDTYIARMLARVHWDTLPAVDGGAQGAARYPVVRGDEAWLAEVQQVLLSSEPYAFGAQHVGAARALCPNAAVRIVDGEAISWYGPRAVAGLRYLRGLAA